MPENHPAIALERIDAIDSTSLEARRRLASGPPPGPLVLVAARQTGGIGRLGRRWESPRGGLWMTLIWPLGPDRAGVLDGLGLRIGLACTLAVERVAGGVPPVRLKWPNDVLIGGRKALGVLTEVVGDTALVGVGVNADFDAALLPPEVRERATTLREATGLAVDVGALRDGLLCELTRALTTRGLSGETLSLLRSRLHGIGEAATLRLGNGAVMRGTLLGLADDGRVRLSVDGVETLAPAGAEIVAEPR